jgi:tetratricopeptide (TPR) repeat protein
MESKRNISRLNAAQQQLLRRMSVLTDYADLEAIAVVCDMGNEFENIFARLERAGWVVRKKFDITAKNSEIRFKVTDFAHDKAYLLLLQQGEQQACRRRQTEYFRQLSETAAIEWYSPRQPYWRARLELEQPHLQESLGWTLENSEYKIALQLVANLLNYWRTRGLLSEGRAWAETALALYTPDDDPAALKTYANVLLGTGTVARMQGDYARADECYNQALPLYRQLNDMRSVANTLNNLGMLAKRLDNYEQAYSFLEEGLTLYRQQQNTPGVAGILNNLGLVALGQLKYEQAIIWLKESLELKRQSGNPVDLISALGNLGLVYLLKRAYNRAEGFFMEALQISRQLSNQQTIAICFTYLAHIAYGRDEWDDALVLFKQALLLLQELGDKPDMEEALSGMAALAVMREDYGRAARLFGAVARLRKDMGNTGDLALQWQDFYSSAIRKLEIHLEPFIRETAWQEGYRLPMDDVIARAMEI